jgi:hypothetical protein
VYCNISCPHQLNNLSALNCPGSDGQIQYRTTRKHRQHPPIHSIELGRGYQGIYRLGTRVEVRRRRLTLHYQCVATFDTTQNHNRGTQADDHDNFRDGNGVLKTLLSPTQLIYHRFLGFLACCGGGIACFGIAFLFLPLRR